MVKLILAIDENSGIGYGNKLPWNIKSELCHFKKMTLYKTLVVGRKTAETLPYLEDRKILVLTRNNIENSDYRNNVKIIHKLPDNDNNVIIAGGKEVYMEALTKEKYVDTIYLSVVKGNYISTIILDKFYELVRDFYIDIVEDYSEFTYYKLIRKDHGEVQYLNLMKEILDNNNVKIGRNGKTLSKFNANFTFDLRNGFPLLTTKKMFFRGIVEEFLFFLRGETDTKILSDKKVKIWEGNTTKEFIKSKNLDYAEGVMGPMYGYQWRNFNAPYLLDKDKKPLNIRTGIDQLANVIGLINNEPTSRRILMTSYNPAQAEEGVLYPCHSIIIQFNVDNEFLDMFCYNRSQDLFLGVPYNIASSSILLTLIANITNKTPRNLHMTMGDVHIYDSHIDSVKEQLNETRIPYKFPNLKINNYEDYDNLNFEDFVLTHYKSHCAIKANMVA